MIQRLILTFADGKKILGQMAMPIYYQWHFGQQDIIEVFSQLSPDFNESHFKKIIPTQTENH